MPARHLVCASCDGLKVDKEGQTCLDCGGQGGSVYGEDRPRGEIEKDIIDVERILRMDEEELSRAKVKLPGCKPELVAGCYAHIESCKGGIMYWQFRLDMLRKELIHCRSLEEVKGP